jgi:ketosteroid isomerase-like protein
VEDPVAAGGAAARPIRWSRGPPHKEEKEMSVEDTQRTLDEYLDALVSGGDFAAKFSDQVSWTTMETGEEIHGREAVRDFIVALHSQLFDATPELRNVYVGDGSAALEAVFVGKHMAEFAGIAATGDEVRLPYAVCYDVSDGKIDALRGYFPILALVQQLKKAAER